MLFSLTNFIKSHCKYFLLGFLYFSFGFLFLIITRVNIYYNIDPDAIYVANAVALTSGLPVRYIDHPGTFYIQLLALFLVPLHLYAEFIHKSFISLAIDNLTNIFSLFRLFSGFAFLIGLVFYAKSAYRLTKSRLSQLIIISGIIALSIVPKWSFTIGPESLLLLLSGIWLWVSVNILERKYPYSFRWYLPVIAGLALSSKLTSLSMVLSTVLFLLTFAFQYKSSQQLRKLLKEMIVMMVLLCMSFLYGVWPILSKLVFFRKWVVNLATYSGVHGSGLNTLFDYSSYMKSFSLHIRSDFFVYLFIIFIPFIIIRFKRFKNYEYINRLLLPLFIANLSTLLIYMKYSEIYYQIVNYSNIIFIFSFIPLFIPKLKSIIPVRIIQVLLIGFVCLIVAGQYNNLNSLLSFAKSTDYLVKKYYDKSAITIWTSDPPTQENALLFGETFSLAYGQDLKDKKYPKKIYYYDPKPVIIDSYGNRFDFSTFCWRNAFIGSTYLSSFLSSLKPDLHYQIIENSDKKMYFIINMSQPECVGRNL